MEVVNEGQYRCECQCRFGGERIRSRWRPRIHGIRPPFPTTAHRWVVRVPLCQRYLCVVQTPPIVMPRRRPTTIGTARPTSPAKKPHTLCQCQCDDLLQIKL